MQIIDIKYIVCIVQFVQLHVHVCILTTFRNRFAPLLHNKLAVELIARVVPYTVASHEVEVVNIAIWILTESKQ